jgi:hypothetical protein
LDDRQVKAIQQIGAFGNDGVGETLNRGIWVSCAENLKLS